MTGFQLQELITKTKTSIPFKRESNLIQIVIESMEQFVSGQDVYASTEIPVFSGIVDIIGGRVERKPVHTDEDHRIFGIDACVLSSLYYKQRLKLETIVRRADLDHDIVQASMERLCRLGYSVQSGNCYLRSRPFIADIVSIEGKRKDWKRALQQAYRNKLFSTRSFVAMDARHARPALRNIQKFQSAEVGLAIVFSNGEIATVYTPPYRKPSAPIMPIIAETTLIERMSDERKM